jgi:hypothetical protein
LNQINGREQDALQTPKAVAVSIQLACKGEGPLAANEDVISTLPEQWEGSNEELYLLVPVWPNWSANWSSLGIGGFRTRSFLTTYQGVDYAVTQTAEWQGYSAAGLRPEYSLYRLDRLPEGDDVGWEWHRLTDHAERLVRPSDGEQGWGQAIREQLPKLLTGT